jgi:hypothetical protein
MSSRPASIGRKRELSEFTREILNLRGRVGRSIYHIGRLLDGICRDKLWRDGGYDSFSHYVEAALDISCASSFRFMRIARHFNAEIAKRYGISKLEAAIAYLEATTEKERPGDLLSARIRIRGPDGRYRQLALHQASAVQIREAVVLLRDSQRGAQRIPRTFRGHVNRLEAALPAVPTGTRSGDRVRIMRGDDGRLALTFQAIPVDQLAAFVDALHEHLPEL